MQKLSGNAKFELDTKINKYQFFHLLEYMATDNVSAADAIVVDAATVSGAARRGVG